MATPNTKEPIRLETNSRWQIGISAEQAHKIGRMVGLLLMEKPKNLPNNKLH